MCYASTHYESRELTFPLQNGSVICSTLMAAVKTAEAIQRRGASYCDNQPPNCSFEVITRQVRAISSTMPETNKGGQAGLMRSKPLARLPVWVPGALKRRQLPRYPGNYLHLCGVYSHRGGGGGCVLAVQDCDNVWQRKGAKTAAAEGEAYCSFISEENPLKKSRIVSTASKVSLKICFHTPNQDSLCSCQR